MPIGDFLRRRPAESQACGACGNPIPAGSTYCPACGVRADDPEAQPLHIVDRATGLFNDRFIRPVLEDELARAHRYGRPLGILLIEVLPPADDAVTDNNRELAAAADEGGRGASSNGEAAGADADAKAEDALKVMAAAIAGTLRDVDTPGVLAHRPPRLMAVLPDTDMSGTANAANRVLHAVNGALAAIGRRAGLGLVCVHPAQRFRAGAVIEAASRSLQAGRPELIGR